jgi:hypothetical protein
VIGYRRFLPYLKIAFELYKLLCRYVEQKQTNSVALSPRANYTDRSTATCRRNLVPTFVDRGVSRGQGGGSPTVVNLSFLYQSRYFLSSSSSRILTRAEWTTFQTHCYSENLVAQGIEPGTTGLAARDSDHWTTEEVGRDVEASYKYKII